jgi:hypothetical protein
MGNMHAVRWLATPKKNRACGAFSGQPARMPFQKTASQPAVAL